MLILCKSRLFKFCVETTDTEDAVCFCARFTSGVRTGVGKHPVPKRLVLLRCPHEHFHQDRYSHSTAQKRSKSERLLP